jgi:hypothetical protein
MGNFNNIQTIPEVNTVWGGEGCRVIGCESDLSKEKVTNKKYRLCQAHKACDALSLNGTLCRFCSQCSSLRPVSDFEGAKRGCKACSSIKRTSRRSSKTQKIGKEGGAEQTCNASAFLPGGSMSARLELIHDPSTENVHTEASKKDLLTKRRRFFAEQELTQVTVQLIEIKYEFLKGG